MRSRWYHRPSLHVPVPGRERKVGWLELFYDLVYAATLIQLGDGLSENVSAQGFLAFAGLFFPLWFLWTGFTFYTNRFDIDDAAHRGFVFLQIFAVGAMGVSAPDAFAGHPAPFALAYAAGRGIQILQYLRIHRHVEVTRPLTRRYALIYAFDLVCFAVSAFVPQPWTYLLWALGAGASLSIPLSRVTRELSLRFAPDIGHASERYGLLVLIVLGEGFMKVLSTLTAHGASTATLVNASLLLLITCSLWWIYFDDVAGSRIKARRGAPLIWVYSHLPLGLAVTAVGVAMKKAIFFELEAHAPAGYRWLLAGTLAGVFVFVAAIDHVTERHHAEVSDSARTRVRLASAAVLLLLAPAGQAMPGWVFLALVAAVAVLQVVLDLAMAPLADDHPEHAELHHAERDRPGDATTPARFMPSPSISGRSATSRRGLVDTIRRGTPNELRRDLFFMLMEASWARFFLTIGAVYLVLNVVFASLYLLDPNAINAARPDSFADAFFFSVQTMATIGYGVLNPGTDWANTLVVVESAAGILITALATGLTFAKANRPRSAIMFSNTAVVNTFEGKPTLMFRVGNVCGNDIVDASARVAVLIDRRTAEGHTFRRVLDLTLVRDTQLIFALSWTVMHVIDAQSPLFGQDWDASREVVGIIVTMSGHDSTYNQTVYTRHFYALEDVRAGHRFADMNRTLPDGRLLLDYSLIHTTQPEVASPT